ncbi:MAG: TAXI family TRAP transporter solute-binding subunit [Actinomycetaceae bacterium]|nr:TAXI family TRAP transporter solute-binding subunit [Actinomycetaceae bacterium]
MRKQMMLAMTAAAALTLAACSGGGEGGDAEGGTGGEGTVDFVTIAAGGTSGPYYQISATMAQIFADELGADASPQATGASVENIELITSDRAELAFAMGDATRQAVEGTGPFEGKDELKDLKALTALYPNFVQIVTTADSGINSVEDMKGKRIGVGDQNSGVELNARMIFEAHGMTYDDITEDYLSYSDAIDQMKNGQVDAAFVTSGLPNASVLDLVTSHDVKIVPIEGEGMKKLIELYPFFNEDVIPGGTYDEEEDVSTASIMNQLLVSPSLSDDEVYALTKAMFENLDKVHQAHNAATNITLDSVEDGLAVELHPGAKRYFEEQGAL